MKRPSNLRAARDIAPADAAAFDLQRRKSVPHEFVLEAISSVSPRTRPMFGCLAVYVDEKIVLVLRDKQDYLADNGVWLATTVEHHESLRREFPAMRSIGVLGKGVTGWQVLPANAADFEELALRACELVVRRDPRIGKVPGARRSKPRGAKTTGKCSKPAPKTRRSAKPRSGK